MQRCPACDHIQFVEAHDCERCGAPLPTPAADVPAESAPAPGSLEAEVLQIAARGNKIEAIKRYREGTKASLKDAKDAVESLMDRYQVRSRTGKSGCAGVLLLCLGSLALRAVLAL